MKQEISRIAFVALLLGKGNGFISPLRPALRTLPKNIHCPRVSTRSISIRATLLDKVESSVSEISNNITDYFPENFMTDTTFDISLDRSKSMENAKVEEPKENKIDLVEAVVLGTWISGLSAFLLANNFVGPWPAAISSVPVQYYGLAHALGGMLFAGGIILTTLIEWLVVSSEQPNILKFWFSKVPGLDSFIVLPALTASIISGVGLAVDHYNSLGESPPHVVAAISTLLAFAGWWAATDLTTQGAADKAAQEFEEGTTVPRIVELRKISNVISCLFVVALYAIMVLKPGYNP